MTTPTDQLPASAGGAGGLTAAEADELKNPGYELFIAGLSVLSILNMALQLVVDDEALNYVLMAMNALLSLVLFFDFCLRLATADSRSDYFVRQYGWADLLASLPLMQLKVLRVFRLIRVYRLLREYGARNLGRTLIAQRAGSALLSLLFLAILVLEFGSLAMLGLESNSPDANIKTASDALWYTIVTISTVGYGDQFPVTNAGRMLGVCVIVVGVGIFGTLTGYLANAFLAPGKSPADDPATAAGDGEDKLATLARLGELKSQGVLTEEEFAAEKAKVLGG